MKKSLGPGGIEPSTAPSRGECSTAALQPQLNFDLLLCWEQSLIIEGWALKLKMVLLMIVILMVTSLGRKYKISRWEGRVMTSQLHIRNKENDFENSFPYLSSDEDTSFTKSFP